MNANESHQHTESNKTSSFQNNTTKSNKTSRFLNNTTESNKTSSFPKNYNSTESNKTSSSQNNTTKSNKTTSFQNSTTESNKTSSSPKKYNTTESNTANSDRDYFTSRGQLVSPHYINEIFPPDEENENNFWVIVFNLPYTSEYSHGIYFTSWNILSLDQKYFWFKKKFSSQKDAFDCLNQQINRFVRVHKNKMNQQDLENHYKNYSFVEFVDQNIHYGRGINNNVVQTGRRGSTAVGHESEKKRKRISSSEEEMCRELPVSDFNRFDNKDESSSYKISTGETSDYKKTGCDDTLKYSTFSSRPAQHIMEQKDYIHRVISAISTESSVRLTQAVFEESIRREFLNDPSRPGFKLGHQTSQRTRMFIPLAEFKERKLLMKEYKRNIKMIWSKNPEFARNFKPNVILCFLVKQGGYLRLHHNEKTSDQPFIAIWSFGCTLTYVLRPYRDKSTDKKQTKETHRTSEFEFNLKSQDFLMIDGVKVKHGYKECNEFTFMSEGKVPLYHEQIGVTEEYRLGIVLFQFDDIIDVPVYFYNGKAHSEPKYG
jgi:hypothetical protein